MILTSRKQSHAKIPWFFQEFSNSMVFPCMEFFQPFSMFSRACGNPAILNMTLTGPVAFEEMFEECG